MSQWFDAYGFAAVHDDLVIGAFPLDEHDVEHLAAISIERVLNLVEDTEYEPGRRFVIEAAYRDAGIEEHRMRLTDFGRLPADQLEAAVQTVVPWMEEGAVSYVHCRAGWQRSAAVAAGSVAVYEGVDIVTALDYVRRRKPSADPLPHQRDDLFAWWQARGARRSS